MVQQIRIFIILPGPKEYVSQCTLVNLVHWIYGRSNERNFHFFQRGHAVHGVRVHVRLRPLLRDSQGIKRILLDIRLD